jgi:hypothetical protein
MIYVLETGEYSDYQYHALYQGPDDIDLEKAYGEATGAAGNRVESGWLCPNSASWGLLNGRRPDFVGSAKGRPSQWEARSVLFG